MKLLTDSTLTRFYIAGVPSEERDDWEEGDDIIEEWVEAPSAAEAAHMASLLYTPWPWYFSRIEWLSPQTGEPLSMTLTMEDALNDLETAMRAQSEGK